MRHLQALMMPPTCIPTSPPNPHMAAHSLTHLPTHPRTRPPDQANVQLLSVHAACCPHPTCLDFLPPALQTPLLFALVLFLTPPPSDTHSSLYEIMKGKLTPSYVRLCQLKANNPKGTRIDVEPFDLQLPMLQHSTGARKIIARRVQA